MSPAFHVLGRLRANLGLQLYRWRADHMRREVSHPATGTAFSTFGAPDATIALARYHMGVEHLEELRVKTRWNPLGTVAAARRQARRHGLAVFSERSAPAALRPDLLPLESYVDLDIPLPGSLREFKSALGTSAASDISRIRRLGYRVEFDRDAGWSERFHAHYHEPSIQFQHGDDGFVSSAAEMARFFTGGRAEWLRVYQGDICVAAMLGEAEARGYRLHRLGWLEGSPTLRSQGVVAALYWFSIQRTFDLGLPRLHLGGVKPDLEDGLFFFKTKWGGRLDPANRRFSARLLLLDPSHPAARAFIGRHSLISRDPAGRHIVLSSRLPAEVGTFAAQASALSAWFRLREAPDPVPDSAKAVLPGTLRPWFDAVALPGAG